MCPTASPTRKRNLVTALLNDIPKIKEAVAKAGDLSLPGISLWREDVSGLHTIAQILYMRDGQQLIESLCNGELFSALKDSVPRWALHHVPTISKYQRCRLKKAAAANAPAAPAAATQGCDANQDGKLPSSSSAAPSTPSNAEARVSQRAPFTSEDNGADDATAHKDNAASP
eukprot:100896-Pyramimonas_sp.AAC.1